MVVEYLSCFVCLCMRDRLDRLTGGAGVGGIAMLRMSRHTKVAMISVVVR